jgi:hypothetical protein
MYTELYGAEYVLPWVSAAVALGLTAMLGQKMYHNRKIRKENQNRLEKNCTDINPNSSNPEKRYRN